VKIHYKRDECPPGAEACAVEAREDWLAFDTESECYKRLSWPDGTKPQPIREIDCPCRRAHAQP